MRNYIILNGVNSNTIDGLLIQKLPPISKPKIRTQVDEIDGRDGDIVTKLGYAAYDKEIEIGLYGAFDINEIIAFFNSEGTITFSNEPDKYYNYQILDQIDFEKLIRFKTATVTLHVQPFKYSTTEEEETFDVETTEAEGTDIILSPSSSNLLTMTIKGNTSQEQSRNLYKTAGNHTYSTFTTTDNGNGSITVTGSTSYPENPVALTPTTSYSLAAGTYTFSITQALPFNIYFMFSMSGSMESATIPSGETSVTFTVGSAITQYRLWINGLTSGTNYNETIYIQIEPGSSATSWLPYGVPSPTSPSEVKTVTGDNTITITNGDSSESQSYPLNLGVENLFSGDNPVTVTRYKWVDFSLPVGKYTIMASSITKSTSDTNYCYIRFMVNSSTQSTSVNLDFNNPIATFTLNTAITGIYFYSSTGASTAVGITANFNDLMILKGTYSNRVSYSPYGTTPIELCKIGDYQDYIYKINGNWYIHKEIGKVVLDGSEDTWSTVQAYSKTFFINTVSNILVSTSGDNDALLRCDNYNNYKSNDIVSNNGKDYGICRRNNQSQLLFRNKDIGTLNDFQTWLGTHNTIVYYPLATPTEEEITNTNLISQLDALSNASGYDGTTHISSTYAKAPKIIAASIVANNSFTVTNNGNIISKPIITIYGSGTINLNVNGYQLFVINLGTQEFITIDASQMEAYNGSTLMNRLVTGDYDNLVLNPGSNTIGFNGNVTQIIVDNYSRWL